ncbi:MAG TPA: hypothetical protein VM695_06750, partial [Phycisphaerae bacterium]|nr:hypothetical protein [Phycisphaerae bacterium]
GPEVADYLRRYRPQKAWLLGPGGLDRPHEALPADSAVAAACTLARTFWKTSSDAVVCPEDDYAAGLVASALAARLRAPLLFAAKAALSAGASDVLHRLQPKRAIVIGKASAAAAGLKGKGITIVELADAKAALAWAGKQKLSVTYLAAVNPTDRTRTAIKKLSLAGALLAAARDGLVVPLAYDVRWKVGFVGEDCGKEPPQGTPKSKLPPRKGAIELDGQKVPFVATGEPKDRNGRLNLDRNGNGRFDDPGEGPMATGDRIQIAGKEYVISLGRKNGVGEADVRLTWPTAEQVCGDLRACYDALGRAPEHLCLVGFPDAIPQGLISNGPSSPTDLTTDLPYSNADADPFAEIGVARLIAEDVGFASLYASRAITYPDLLDDSWRRNVGEARWENTYTRLFQNVGFHASVRHDRDDLKWLVPPAEGVKGKRAREFDANSPLTRVAALTHMAHSWWKDLGQTFTWDSPVLLAPVLVESGGCLTATLDREADCRSVIARLLRNGAVGFAGNSRPGIAHQELQRLEFWNGVLAGRTIGQAHRMALNSTTVTVLEGKQTDQGPDRYQLHIRTLFGDPAFRMHVPSKPRSAPARMTVEADLASVHAPAEWWPVKMRVPEDWKKWADKDLYVCRGAGTYALRHWCGEQYDREVTCYTAEVRTPRRVKAIHQVQSPPAPLGWTGHYYVDEHADGTRSYRWRVQLIDFDQIHGKITAQVDRLDYRIEWADAAKPSKAASTDGARP